MDDRKNQRVLVVDDDLPFLEATRTMLEEHGYTIVEAADGTAALEIAASNQRTIDLLLTDVVMRGLNGPELSARLRASNPGLKVVYMSGYTGELIAEHDFLQPGVTLLEKPFTRASLLSAIDKTLG